MATLDDYIGLITSEHRDKPNYIAFLTAVLNPLVNNLNVALSLPQEFDVENAIGAQLDAVGYWVGASRYVPIPLTGVYFTWNDVTPPTPSVLGWNLGYWKGAGTGILQPSYLPDPLYRIYIYAKIANNQFLGSSLQAYNTLFKVFASSGVSIFITDSQNMNMGLRINGQINDVLRALLNDGYLDLRPMGVQLTITINP